MGLERAKERNLFATQVKEYTERRDILTKVFDDLGMKYTLPQGSCFVLLVCQLSAPNSPYHPTIFAAHSFLTDRIYPISKYQMISHSPSLSAEEVETSGSYLSAPPGFSLY